jgi:D-arabinose 1-dehydrogenase-like Zn-dependent alcohol dehydrogenase
MAVATPESSSSSTSALTSYRAAVVHDFDSPLTLERVARPALQDGQVLVRVEASGLCHTDIHAAHGDWPIKPSPPFIPGHEGVGIIEELGPGVGDRAGGSTEGVRAGIPHVAPPRHARVRRAPG